MPVRSRERDTTLLARVRRTPYLSSGLLDLTSGAFLLCLVLAPTVLAVLMTVLALSFVLAELLTDLAELEAL